MVTPVTIKKGYKQTELGVIPEDWDVKKLNDIATITRLAGYEYSSMWEEKENGEIIALRGFNIGKNRIIEKEFSRISNELSLKLRRSRLYKNDVIYPCVGTIGNAVVIEEDDKYHIQQNIAKITPKENEVQSYYLAHYLMSHLGLNEITKFNGTSSQPNILVGSLRQYSIVLPSAKLEQTTIATVLSDTDALIEGLEKLIAKKKAIKQGAMQPLLTGKRRLSGFSGEWEEKKLRDIADFFKGRGLSKSKIDNEGNYSCILYGELFTTYSQVIKEVKSKTNYKEGLPSANGDILMPGSTTTVGIDLAVASALQQSDVLLGGDVIVIRKKELHKYNSEFLANYLTHIAKYKIAEITQGITIIHLHGSRLQEIFVKIPSDIKEQTAIATILSDMDAEIESLEQNRDKYKMIKQGMMQELLTGRTRLI